MTCVRLVLCLALVASAGCKSSNAPAAPSTPAGLSAPSAFRITQQKVFFTGNEVNLSWTGQGTSYRIMAGTALGQADALTAETTGTTYTWNAPRTEAVYYIRVEARRGAETSPPTVELPVYTIDLRHVIDALYFRSGPMADTPSTALGNPSSAVWPDGTALRVRVSNESGETARMNAQIFADEYAAIGGGAITGATETTSEDFKAVTLTAVPLFQILVRVLSGFCGGSAIACAYYGPSPVGINRSIVTMNGASGGISLAHEMGHAYGLGHVRVNAAVRPELNFMMNPALLSAQMTEPEKNAIAAAREGGLGPGWTRNQALSAGLVLPYTGSVTSGAAGFSISGSPRSEDQCRILDGPAGAMPQGGR